MKYETVVAALSQMVLSPVASELQKKRLLIVPDGALQNISFAALPLPVPAAPPMSASAHAKSPDHQNATLLVMEHEIANLPAASALAELRREANGRTPAPQTVAVLADPVFAGSDGRVRFRNQAQAKNPARSNDRKKDEHDEIAASAPNEHLTRSASDLGLRTRGRGAFLVRLLFSRREAKAILAVTPAGKGMEALDFQASRATATNPQLAQYRVVHFATHALLDNEHPELSGLVLSLVDENGKPQNGFLELQDIYNLNLSADLVVLSACETGLGKDVRGEGLVGLTRGFMYAGASRVVASLWSVDDEATAELMKRFYQAMELRGMSPAAALREAQIAISRQERWHDPYYWAGFVLQGEWR
jgi:CHAT domain-containing protein